MASSRGVSKRSRKRSRTSSVSSTHAAVASSKTSNSSFKGGRGNKKRASGKSKRGSFSKSSNIQGPTRKQRCHSKKTSATPPPATSSRGPRIPTTTNLNCNDSDDEYHYS